MRVLAPGSLLPGRGHMKQGKSGRQCQEGLCPSVTPNVLLLVVQGGSIAQMLYKQMSQTHRAYSNYEVRTRGWGGRGRGRGWSGADVEEC